jgi:hypothetical protein
MSSHALRSSKPTRWLAGVAALLLAGSTAAQPLRFDFQPANGPVADGYIAVAHTDLYTASKGFGFLLPPARSMNGVGKTWNVFGRIVTVDDAVPASVLSDASRDAVVTDAIATPNPVIEFRADVAPGSYDLIVWLGDVTQPRFRIEAEANGVIGRATRVDVNDRRGTFDQTQFGSSAPVRLRVNSADGTIVLRVRRDDSSALDPIFGPLAASGAATAWTFLLDQAKALPPTQVTATLVPAFNGVALQALEIVPASEPPLVLNDNVLSAPGAAPDPLLSAALAAFNTGDLNTARAAFQGLDGNAKPLLKAAGLLWVAGHPAQISDESALIDAALALLDSALQNNSNDNAARALRLQASMTADVERYRGLFGYQASGAPAAENMGRSGALAELFGDDHPYARKARIVWLRNRGGLDPLRNTVSWERAQWLAQQFDPQWGTVNPFVRLYATDQWNNDGQPWARVDWPTVLSDGPGWARQLAGNLNVWLDLFEWWSAHRQSAQGDIGGGWTDDVEIVPAFGLMALALPDSSSLSALAFRRFADGIWQSDVIDPEAGFQAQFADVEHVAEPNGNLLHIQLLLDYGAPEPVERMLRSARTFRDVFLSAPGESPLGHRHVRGNFMSATSIDADGAHAADIPLNGRITGPFPFLLWYAANPGVQAPLQDWATSWIADAARTDNDKPAGVFPNTLWVPTEGIGAPGGNWWGVDNAHGQFSAMPTYHWYPYALTGFFAGWTGDPVFSQPFDAIQTHANAWQAAGKPELGGSPTPGQESIWAGGKLKGTAVGAITNLRLLNGSTQWNTYLQNFASGYSRFLLNPTDARPIADLQTTADKLAAGWPYKTSEGVMTDRILEPGWIDVLSYYLGADATTLFFGMPAQQVSWENSSRLFAAAVTGAGPGRLDASVYLFSAQSRTIRMRLWQLPPGDYVLSAGPANGLGQAPTPITQQVAFHIDRRGDRVSFELPGKTTYAIRIQPAGALPPSIAGTPRADAAVAPDDLGYDADNRTLTVRVHNTGALDLFDLTVVLHAGNSASGPVLGQQPLPVLLAPLDLSPSWLDVVFTDVDPLPAYTVAVLSPVLDTEVSTDNNTASGSGLVALTPPSPPVIEQVSPSVAQPGATISIHGQHFSTDMSALDAGSDNPLLQLLVFSDTSAQLVLSPDLQAPTQVLLSLATAAGVGNTVPLPVLLDAPVNPQPLDPADQYLWLVPPAANLSQQGFVRLSNHSAQAGLVQVWGVDETGRRSPGTAMLSLGPLQSQQLNSVDLELGNPAKGLSGALGSGSGRWLLVVSSDLDLEVLGYVRTPDGFLTAVHDRNAGDGVDWWVPFFNPAQNPNQISQLRIVNQEAVMVGVEITGIDDTGMPSSGSVITSIAPLASLQLSASELESGGLGDGDGKWQLQVSATGQITVQSLLLDPNGKLTNLSTALASTQAGPRTVGFLPAAANLAQQGFVRLINRSDQTGTIMIAGIDDSGQPANGAATVTIGPRQSLQFNSLDLEQGNPEKGLDSGIGSGSGDWRLQVASALDIVPMALIRTPDGFLTSIHDRVTGDGLDSVVPLFNPAQNPNQVSALRLVNPGTVAATAAISGRDDNGNAAPGGALSLSLAPGTAREFSAVDLEQGNTDKGLVGALGDGEGKWRLHIDANIPILAIHLLRSPNGFITNLSRATQGSSDTLGATACCL